MIITAKMMKSALERFIIDNGEDCPVYYQIFSFHDVVDYDNDGSEDAIVYDRDFADKVITDLHQEDHITEYIFDTIGDVIRHRLARQSH